MYLTTRKDDEITEKSNYYFYLPEGGKMTQKISVIWAGACTDDKFPNLS